MNTDDVHTEKRDVSDFDQVALTGFGELVIMQGEEESLTIEAPQDILSRIETEVVDGKLIIGVSRSWLDWIGVTGRVAEQTISIRGAGSYDASRLESQKAEATLEGFGSATVWAAEELDVVIRGVGSLSYYGSPKVSTEIAGPGSVSSLGNP